MQFRAYPVKSVAVFEVAGGNGLGNLIPSTAIKRICGIDINTDCLAVSKSRYPELGGGRYSILSIFWMVVAFCRTLCGFFLIEYVGCKSFVELLGGMPPQYVSCVIQLDPQEEDYV